ncbi:hypothetical protein S2091_4256 [Solimicrobium silvestre]|uniref:Uncharacterized protein n=1 Tax=Solimicrobium silvestre TaxID=2099400 RepID=A0A2S9GTQ0_9BURK|nr:hypothetical protein S2091_4256 [Solimicrobium silvestre]
MKKSNVTAMYRRLIASIGKERAVTTKDLKPAWFLSEAISTIAIYDTLPSVFFF